MRGETYRTLIQRYRWVFLLFIITFIAIFLRALPSLLNAAWGVDFGIYYGLTNSFVETKTLINPYNGWGASYQYFPVLYAITGFAHFITGIDTLQLLPKIAPIFGGLTIPILYFIVHELFKDRNIALISSALLATATFHVYQTSHAAPLTIGHFFMMISIYFFIKFSQKNRYLIPLLLSTALLIMSHHFTMYFYLISVTFMLFSYAYFHPNQWKKSWILLSYVLIASSAAFTYWITIASPVYEGFMNGTLIVSSPYVILLYYLSTLTGFYFCLHSEKIKTILPSFNYQFKKISMTKKVVFSFVILLITSLIAMQTGIPGVYIKLTPLAILYSLPMILLASFSFAGFSLLKKQESDYLIKGWILALIGSFLFSIFSAQLLPDRHLEYLIVPLCIPAALSMYLLIKNQSLKDLKSVLSQQPFSLSSETIQSHLRPLAFLFIIGALIIANTMVAYPTIDALDTLDERVSDPCISVLDWMDGNVSSNSTIASDHRLSMLCWAHGYNITFGETNITWTAGQLEICLPELQRLNITHILIDDIMRDNVINIDVGKYYYMTNASYNKFLEEPFSLIYRNATLDNDFEEIHWIELYEINYSQIQHETTYLDR